MKERSELKSFSKLSTTFGYFLAQAILNRVKASLGSIYKRP